MPPEEQQRLLALWNNTEKAFPRDACVAELVARQAAARPEAPAVVMDEGTLRYGELNRRANQLAWHLQQRGVGPETLVAVCLERSFDFVVALLGVLKAGGAYVPLDPAYPTARQNYMLRDAQTPLLITRRQWAELLTLDGVQTVLMDDDREALAQQREDDPPQTVQPDNLAYVIYTSGSTGQPKGSLIQHEGLLNLIFWHREFFGVTERDRANHMVGVAFDGVAWDLWCYLTVGASLHVPSDAVRVDPVALHDWLIAQEITVASIPTVLTEQLLGMTWPAPIALRILNTAAERLTRYPPAGLPFTLVNNYGPSECTVNATTGIVPPTAYPAGPPAIGRPIANTQIYVLDEDLRQVPIGEVGEIYIGGISLARGYLHRPELTAERFIRHPFREAPDARLYKTGDLARWLPDGQLAFMGRSDDQVKIRGYRIEPGEIAYVLNAHPAIEVSQVIAREDVPGEKRLVAYVVPAAGQDVSVRALQAYVLERLPEYMVPAIFVRLAALPFTPNGKVDRAALPMPDALNTLRDDVGAEPRTPVEAQLSVILGELLGMTSINLDDNFFLLGGHSLLGAQAIARIDEAFGVDVTLRMLFETPTMRQLAAAIEDQILAQLAADALLSES
jgi:amino acid adenylation domain-containing protein